MNLVVPKLVKLFFMVVLHSPVIHPLLSGRWASLEFTGRKTGRPPVPADFQVGGPMKPCPPGHIK